MKTHIVLWTLLFVLTACHHQPDLAALQSRFDQQYRDADLADARETAVEKLQITREQYSSDSPEYIQALYDMALIYRRLQNDNLTLHFYERALDEALRSPLIDTKTVRLLFNEVAGYEADRISENEAMMTLQKVFRRELAATGYPSADLNPLYERLIPHLLQKRDGEALLYAAQNLILTGTDAQKNDGHYYLCLGHYYNGDMDKFRKAAALTLALPAVDPVQKIRIHILLAKSARAEKGILRSRGHYQDALRLFTEVRPNDLILLYDIYAGLGENYFLTRDIDLALEYETNASDLAEEYQLGSDRLKQANDLLAIIRNYKK